MSNIFKVLLHTIRTLCVVLTLLSFIAAEILNTRVGNQIPPGKGSVEPAPWHWMPSWKIFSSQSSIPLANSHLKSLARQEHCEHCTLLPWVITQTTWIWQPFWCPAICFNAHQLVFKTEQGQHICLKVDICLCWALFHESQISVTDLRQILQFTGKKWGHQYIVRYWRHTTFITRWLSLWSLGFLCPFCFGPFSVPAGLSLVCFLLQLVLERVHQHVIQYIRMLLKIAV